MDPGMNESKKAMLADRIERSQPIVMIGAAECPDVRLDPSDWRVIVAALRAAASGVAQAAPAPFGYVALYCGTEIFMRSKGAAEFYADLCEVVPLYALSSTDRAAPPSVALDGIDATALQTAQEIVALPETWTYTRRKAAIQVIVAREIAAALTRPQPRGKNL